MNWVIALLLIVAAFIGLMWVMTLPYDTTERLNNFVDFRHAQYEQCMDRANDREFCLAILR